MSDKRGNYQSRQNIEFSADKPAFLQRLLSGHVPKNDNGNYEEEEKKRPQRPVDEVEEPQFELGANVSKDELDRAIAAGLFEREDDGDTGSSRDSRVAWDKEKRLSKLAELDRGILASHTLEKLPTRQITLEKELEEEEGAKVEDGDGADDGRIVFRKPTTKKKAKGVDSNSKTTMSSSLKPSSDLHKKRKSEGDKSSKKRSKTLLSFGDEV